MSKRLDIQTPPAGSRDLPFWVWNGTLVPSVLLRQIGCFRRMGMGGFFMHPRSGLKTPYLGQEFMAAVRLSVDEARRQGLHAWLYDEDRWPSGSAGGALGRDAALRGVCIVPVLDDASPAWGEDGGTLAAYLVRLDVQGHLLEYRREKESAQGRGAEQGFRRLVCHRRLFPTEEWFNGGGYIDVLNAKATRAFLEATHERYAACVGDEFGKTIPGIFTDEPQMRYHDLPVHALDLSGTHLPYTAELETRHRQAYGKDFWEEFPEILWDWPDGRLSAARYRYLRLLTDLLADSYFRPMSEWCQAHHLALAGHLMGEHSLRSQSGYMGECMLHYHFMDIPGVDMLGDGMELSTVKQAISVARQDGRADTLSELSGATDWDFPFCAHKAHGDWQAALGVTLRVPHLAWYCMEGEAKRDYPASIGEQSPWSAEYPVLADYFARLNGALRSGSPVCDTGVLHPVESFWLLRGPTDTSGVRQSQAEEQFQALVRWLCRGLVDFDFLSEALLPSQKTTVGKGWLQVGAMRYRTILVPPTLTMRATTLEILEAFHASGGRLVFLGRPPERCEAVPSPLPARLAALSQCIPFDSRVLEMLDRPVRVRDKETALPAESLLCQLRQVGDARLLFLCNTQRQGDAFCGDVCLDGEWQLEELAPTTGAAGLRAATVAHGCTRFDFRFEPGGHLLLRLRPAKSSCGSAFPVHALQTQGAATLLPDGRMPITRSEPNVLVLDFARWRVNGGQWRPREEIHRANALLRKELSLPPVKARSWQPYAMPADSRTAQVECAFHFLCEHPFADLRLAMERTDTPDLFWTELPSPSRIPDSGRTQPCAPPPCRRFRLDCTRSPQGAHSGVSPAWSVSSSSESSMCGWRARNRVSPTPATPSIGGTGQRRGFPSTAETSPTTQGSAWSARNVPGCSSPSGPAAWHTARTCRWPTRDARRPPSGARSSRCPWTAHPSERSPSPPSGSASENCRTASIAWTSPSTDIDTTASARSINSDAPPSLRTHG
ncbi:MAG: hypothetical protein IJJ33_00360 [Victivallales bacterium]|nr:hypothetical protein [Victivallales bacterium]